MKKMLIAGIILLIIWFSFLWFVINYAQEVREHPCQICADKIGEDITCSYYTGENMVFLSNSNGTAGNN